ncbi:tRNA(Ile)-lysidine synthase [Wohlfahrtiimonas chitiniclastica SH04]|uniref:tRNA(Ile)-lysidine synthase n=1 Tax=Wohlfahrtiimonas chitiniclastica SH04 TaxID=1261130 RepID=L8XXP1_9GAMM|nr:tRNA lysidine(34) synthetase TilS [Wohlfahrtiimonas chitiniclastica]ELV07505.1 tRNA(Ile)-lysidine synthase [Wohlfahrtiimonas chitiniclastica SH04]
MTPDWYEEIFQKYHAILNEYDHLYIGLSAGIDSNMLLHWLHTYRAKLPPITAIHVNHQWHGEDSIIWANFARDKAKHYGIDFINYDVVIDIDQKGAEACGREARYIQFAKTMAEMGGKGLLLVAHHRSDQAETVMYRLLRGSGTLGLGGMRAMTTLHFGDHALEVLRPLLSISKSTLYQTGKRLGIAWMEDYTNHGVEEARNQIRNGIFPKVAEFFPHYEQTFARSAELIQESDALLLEIAEMDGKRAIANGQLDLTEMRTLSRLRQKNLLRHWLNLHHVILEKRQFDECFAMFVAKKPTSESCFAMHDWCIRAFEHTLYFLKPKPVVNHRVAWVKSDHAPPLSFWRGLDLMLVNRENGGSFHPMWRDRSQTVKKLLQEIALEPWLRHDIQLLKDRATGEVIWIEHLGLSQRYQALCEPSGILPTIIREH